MRRSTPIASRPAVAGRPVVAGLPVAAAALVAVGALIPMGCSSSAPKANAATLLSKAKATADGADAVHFTLTSSNVTLSGTNLVNGHGDLARPASLSGAFGVAISGFTVNVNVASVGDTFEAELPFTSHYSKTDPSKFGLKNPGVLLDPQHGLTSLLTLAQSPTLGSPQRVAGELLDTVTYSVPGSAVPVIPDSNPSKPVELTVAINPSNYQLRSVKLVGPFTSATSNCTYVVTLSNYNEHVNITLPPAS